MTKARTIEPGKRPWSCYCDPGRDYIMQEAFMANLERRTGYLRNLYKEMTRGEKVKVKDCLKMYRRGCMILWRRPTKSKGWA